MPADIKAVGSFLPLTPDGALINDTSLSHIEPSLAKETVRLYEQWFGDTLRSVYVRGSVARGNAIPGCSDFDTFAVLDRDALPQCPAPTDTELKHLSMLAPGLTQFEFHACTEANVLDSYYSTWPFLIKTQSVCLHGIDYAQQLENYYPGPEVMGEALYVPERLRLYGERLQNEQQVAQKVNTCEWIMKALVRAAFDLTMDRCRQYTRDLWLCHRTFAEYYSAQANDCHQALCWAIEPDADSIAQSELVNRLGAWITNEMLRLVGQYGIDLSRYRL
ncbi:nucleotidyltransferase domain-containing protein [Chitinivorax sp. B]|uniref:nucleotidyltransferase domain-containing protein n=1 Tax=Chitinivorax sp. B TaxID=2502235 RepID=UPI0010F8E858|nr:nucleotidyltransferase domain-containing protein [Chitinivorax sp. B]